MAERALLTGATGFIGSHLGPLLRQRGWKVRVLARNTPPSGWPDNVEVVSGTLDDENTLAQATQGVGVVFHLAAKLHAMPVLPGQDAEFEQVNVQGTRRLLEAARASGARRFVFFSSINVLGPCQAGETKDEDSPPRPEGSYARSKYEAERLVLAERTDAGSALGVVLRLAAVYGPGMKGNYPRLISALRKGRFVPIGRGLNRRTLVHVRDVAEAAILAAEHPVACGKLYHVTDGTVHSVREILHAICAALERRPPRMGLPAWLVRAGASLADRVAGWLGKKANKRALVEKYLEDLAVSGTAIQRELGFRAQVGLESGFCTAVRS